MPIQTFSARLSEKQELNRKFHLLRFELIQPNRLTFQTGQYVLLTVPGTMQKKSYSIASPQQIDHAVDMLIDVAPKGLGTKYLFEMQPGAEVSFMAPVGQFVLAPRDSAIGQTEEELMFIATGSGIAPIKAHLEDLLVYQGDSRPITLYWGLRHIEDQCWFDELGQLAEQHRNFTFHPILSQPPENWPLHRGRVTDCLAAHKFGDLTKVGFYVCGNGQMVLDVGQMLTNFGVPKEHIHHERFF